MVCAAFMAALSTQVHTHMQCHPLPVLQISLALCMAKSMVKICFVWPGLVFHVFPSMTVFPEKRGKCLSSSPHTPTLPWPSSLCGGAMGAGYPPALPWQKPRLSHLSLPDQRDTDREIWVLSFLFNETLWCYSKAHHRMSVWISWWPWLVWAHKQAKVKQPFLLNVNRDLSHSYPAGRFGDVWFIPLILAFSAVLSECCTCMYIYMSEYSIFYIPVLSHTLWSLCILYFQIWILKTRRYL